MQRHILNKRKPSCTHISPRVTLQVLKKDLSKEKPWESNEKTPQKQPLRKIIQKTLDGRRLPTNFDRRPTIRNKIHKNESKLLKQNLQGGKRFIAICDTIPTLSVYYKGSLNEKMESYTKPTVTSPNFQRTTYHFLQERKIPKGHAR